jgi:hypothetical protein
VEITPLMSFRCLKNKMLNSASKSNALKFHLKLKLLNFHNQKKNVQKTQLDGGISPHVKFMPVVNPLSPSPPLYETLGLHVEL